MNPQETIGKMLAVKGDKANTHKRVNYLNDVINIPECSCGNVFKYWRELYRHIDNFAIDLTTEAGAFWLLVRLPAWDRCKEFCFWLQKTNPHFSAVDEFELSPYTIIIMFRWLTSDAKDGEAPALYNALCEFLEVEK